MPRGDDRLAQVEAERREQQERFDASSKPQLWLQDGQRATVRFLEQGPDKKNYAIHSYRNAAGKFRTFTCLNDNEDNTRCPGCESGIKRAIKGVYNVLQRGRPVLRKGQDGRAIKDGDGNYIVDGHEDAVVIVILPATTANIIRGIDANEKWSGIMSRDWELARVGPNTNPYTLEPADPSVGAVAMSEADLALAQGRHNLDEFMTAPTFADAAKICGMAAATQQQPSQQPQTQVAPSQQPAVAQNPFTAGIAPPEQG